MCDRETEWVWTMNEFVHMGEQESASGSIFELPRGVDQNVHALALKDKTLLGVLIGTSWVQAHTHIHTKSHAYIHTHFHQWEASVQTIPIH